MKLTLALILALFAAPAFANGDPAPDTGCKGCGPDKPSPEPTPEPEPEPEPRDPSDPDRGGDTVPATAPGYFCMLDGELVNFRNAVGPVPRHGDRVRVCPWYAHK